MNIYSHSLSEEKEEYKMAWGEGRGKACKRIMRR